MDLDEVRGRLSKGGAKPTPKATTAHPWFDSEDYPRPPADAIYTLTRAKVPRQPYRRSLVWVALITWHDNRDCEVFAAEFEVAVTPGDEQWNAAWACGHCVPWARERAWKPEDGAPDEGHRPRSEQLELPRANDR